MRYYLPLDSTGHRAFVELSGSLLEMRQEAMIGAPVVHDYGPGLSIGYSFLARSGITFTAGVGAARADFSTLPIFDLGLGWTGATS